jgi:hypothetical protein
MHMAARGTLTQMVILLLQVLRVSIVVPHAPPLHALRITTALFHTLETALRQAAAAGLQQGAPPNFEWGLL